MSHNSLFPEFEQYSPQEWEQAIDGQLRGKRLDDFRSATADDLTIEPYYHPPKERPGAQPPKEHPRWDLCEEILVEDEKQANAKALDALQKGASSLIFYLEGPPDFDILLEDIELPYICSNFVTDRRPGELARALSQFCLKQGYDHHELEGSVNFDPLENLLRTGDWFESESSDFEAMARSLEEAPKGMRKLCVNANLLNNAGASPVQELGSALAMAYEYYHRLQPKDLRDFWLNFAIGSQYFEEIAKFRAMRRLWKKLQETLNLPFTELRLYAENSLRNKSYLDKHNNMIRSTAEAMAAVIGGVNELNVKAFDELQGGEASAFARRIARNQSSILQFESYFQQTRDMGGGSYFIEELTEKMAAAGWEFFKAIEAQGGFLTAIQNDWLQKQLSQQAAASQKAFDQGELVLIGVNKFRPDQFEIPALSEAKERPAKAVKPLMVKRLAEDLERQLKAEAKNSHA